MWDLDDHNMGCDEWPDEIHFFRRSVDFNHKPVGADPVWITGQGERLPLSTVDNQHLQNIERFLLGRGARDASARQILFGNWYDTIRTELELRGLTVLGDHPVAHRRQEARDGARLRLTCYEEGELA